MRKKTINITIIVMIALIGIQIASAQTIFSGNNRGVASYVNYGGNFKQYYSGNQLSTYWPALADRATCEARQDVLIQVTPGGCQPAVVRSDLLAEQNVPVFCQLDMLTLNPAIDVKQIRNIRFNGNYPPEVSGVGFHPAQAALRTQNRLLGNPVINNIGYVVVVLKRQPREEDMAEFLNFTLEANIEYWAGNAIGLGRTEFLLQEVTDEEWSRGEDTEQSFLKGEYSVRLKDTSPEAISIDLYHQDKKISTTRVERNSANTNTGVGTNQLYLPGFYCQSAIQLNYDGLISSELTARIQVDQDYLEVIQGSKILNGKCRVRKIIGNEAGGTVEISCGNERIILETKTKVLNLGLEVHKKNEEEKIFTITKIETNTEGKRTYTITRQDGEKTITEKTTISQIIPVNPEQTVFEETYGTEQEEAFQKAIDNYKKAFQDYGSEKELADQNERTQGEIALETAIDFSLAHNKKKTAYNLIRTYLENYPGTQKHTFYQQTLNEMIERDDTLSGKVVNIDEGYKVIRLEEIRTPKKKSSATIILGGQEYNVEEGKTVNTAEKPLPGGVSQVTLNKVVDSEKIKISVACQQNVQGRITGKTLVIGDNEQTTCAGLNVRVRNIDVQKFAKLTMQPRTQSKGTTAFAVGVGIEKRALELTPEKTKERINKLNQTIKKWESISENLGNVVKGLKTACLTTSAVLTVKNFFAGISGEALARQQVMRGDSGWTNWCKNHLGEGTGDGETYDTITECLNKKSALINSDVAAHTKTISQVNKDLELIEEQHKVSGSFFGEDSLKIDEAKQALLTKINQDQVCKQNTQLQGLLTPTNIKEITYQNLRDLYYNCKLKAESEKNGISQEVGMPRVNEEIRKIQTVISERVKAEEARQNTKTFLQGTTVEGVQVDAYGDKESLAGNYYGGTYNGNPAQPITYNSQSYLLILAQKGTNNYVVTQALKVTGTNSIGENNATIAGKFKTFQKRDVNSYNNPIRSQDQKVIYYETEPYKGMPAIIPIDTERGFYAGTKQTLPGLGNIKTYQSNGRPSSFWVCNVMQDKAIDFQKSGFGNDECVQFNTETGQSLTTFPGLGEAETKQVISKAITALQEAAQQYGNKRIRILGKTYDTGNPAAIIPGTQCQDFMSTADCKLLFNVCDPVICPSSRCNFGGEYPVADVIQTGIVGSALLCLPNLKEDVIIPVCLTGIKAGIDGYLSILKSHQECLQENIDSGTYTGICDQTTAVYTCEFFWKQAAPLTKILLPKLVEGLYTGSLGTTRGGGEYLTVQNSWDNAQESINYFTQNYAENSFEAFRTRSVEEAGGEFCRAFIGMKGPASFESLIEPDSPTQFHAYYSEITFSDATVPATSQYKTFYHIFAGNDRGVAYSVYLKDPPLTSYYETTPSVVVASGFVPRGEYATETRDFTAPAGYKQLCVRINDKEECGFKQVSTSFAVNYVKDKIVADEITRTDVQTEKECVSGSTNPSALLNPNLQEAAQEAINPSIYKRGIIRVCATSNPGVGTDETRFVPVGYCDDQRIQCWLDKNSVNNAITEYNKGVKNATLQELEALTKTSLTDEEVSVQQEEFITEYDKLSAKTEKVSTKQEATTTEQEINTAIKKYYLNIHKAKLTMLTGDLYKNLFEKIVDKIIVKNTAEKSEGTKDTDETTNQPSTNTQERIVSVSQDYDWEKSEDAEYLLLNGQPTKIYFENRRFILEKSFIIDYFAPDKDIGGVQEGGKIVLRSGNVFEGIINEALGEGSYDKINGKNIQELKSGINLDEDEIDQDILELIEEAEELLESSEATQRRLEAILKDPQIDECNPQKMEEAEQEIEKANKLTERMEDWANYVNGLNERTTELSEKIDQLESASSSILGGVNGAGKGIKQVVGECTGEAN